MQVLCPHPHPPSGLSGSHTCNGESETLKWLVIKKCRPRAGCTPSVLSIAFALLSGHLPWGQAPATTVGNRWAECIIPLTPGAQVS